MAYQATTLQLLISCPGDIEREDLAAVRKAITRWNVLHGETMEHVVVPVHWSEHASAEFGGSPQTIINRQLVSTVDLGVALFWGRLGTPTAVAASGTAEEIVTLHDAGKPVSVLRCTKPLPARGDHSERARLAEYFQNEIEPRGLVIDYDSSAGLEQQVDSILTRLVRTHEQSPEIANLNAGRRGGAHIVASTDAVKEVRQSSKGRLRESTKHQLILENIGGVAARDINWKFETLDTEHGSLPEVGVNGSRGAIPVISGGGRTVETIHAYMGSARRFVCQVSWLDGDRPPAERDDARPIISITST